MARPASKYLIPVGSAAIVYYSASYYWNKNKSDSSLGGGIFHIPVRSRSHDGRVVTKENPITVLSQAEIERKLTNHAVSYSIPRAGERRGRWRYETAAVASNAPIEDAHAEMIIRSGEPGTQVLVGSGATTSPGQPLSGDMLFFAIMDGHSGYNTSRLLAKTLIPSVALELSSLSAAPNDANDATKGWLSYLKSFIPFTHRNTSSASHHPLLSSYPFASDPKYVSTAIQTAFANLDSNIVRAPIQHINALGKLPLDRESEAYQLAVANLLPALSGSCALLAILDQAREDLYVACTGDSRAVAGYKVPALQGNKWEADDLSIDQTGRSRSELERIQSEHPTSEASAVIRSGRVLGSLEPTRAFGDARYKWTKEFQERLGTLFNVADSGVPTRIRAPPDDLLTPPYVTSRPEVTHRKVSFSTSPSNPSPSSAPAVAPPLRFVVLATDGLWDKLSSSAVVDLVGGYLDRSSHSPSVTSVKPDGWTYTDTNVATHLIRNALAGNALTKQPGQWGLSQLMSIPAPYSRRYRDDITVTVVWWEDDDEQTVAEATLAKAKL
ncbi:hypothetical protein FRB96_007678 [Tulasnella sp. 330]|nr:hypothetical protein FRB96_007678 [Tulasnella sp. 330]KAG8880759.1 hypothetical protein FRB97_000552 [Tulasnella sp. 331]